MNKSVSIITDLDGSKIALINDIRFKSRRGIDQNEVEQYLKEAGMETKLFEGVEPEPSIDSVFKGAQALHEILENPLKSGGRFAHKPGF